MIKRINFFLGAITTVVIFFVQLMHHKWKTEYRIISEKMHSILKKRSYLPDDLSKALVIIEDKRFYSHLGVDFYSIARALRNRLFFRRLEGASTIGQQLVRNLTGNREITVKRKIKEIIFSIMIDRHFTKQEILLAYAHSYPFSKGSGITHFCIQEQYNLTCLTKGESAQIAARFKYPSLSFKNYIKYLKRVRKIEILIEKSSDTHTLIRNELSINVEENNVLIPVLNTVKSDRELQ